MSGTDTEHYLSETRERYLPEESMSYSKDDIQEVTVHTVAGVEVADRV